MAAFLLSGESICFASILDSGDANFMVNNIHNRMNELRLGEFNPSGDDKKVAYGSWVAGSVGKAYYKSQNSVSTNKTKERSNSIMLGSDIKVDDLYTIGACASLGKSELKSFGSSGVTNIKTITFSLYGDAKIAPNIAVIAGIYGGKIQAKNDGVKALKISRDGRIIGANLGAIYYRRIASNTIFAPTVGVSFNQVKLKKSGGSKVVINGLTTDKLSLYTGLALSESFDIGNIKVIPEISARVTYSPIIKSGEIMLIEETGQVVTYQPNVSKAEKTRYSAAVGFNLVLHKMMTLSLNYKKDWQSRYSSDAGFAKLRINF